MEPLGDGDPKRVGPYRLRARLGAGAMGRVFLGETRDKRRAAVKLLRAEFAASPEFRRRFSREAEAARRVNGARTVPVLDADPEAERPWLATAYVPGPTLQEYVGAVGVLRPRTVAALGAGLAEGLAAIHAGGLVHRDLKPGNVIVADHGPVIIDFGISRAVDASTLTATGTVLGTYGYMAPEQITADTATAAGDVFALGCVLAFAAVGKGPFDASTVPAVVHRVVGEAPELGGLAGELRALVEACLAKDPAARPGVNELIARLAALAGGAGAPTRVDPTAGAFHGFSPGRVDAATAVRRTAKRPPAAKAERPAPQGRRRLLNRRNLLVGGLVAAGAAAVPVGWNLWSNRHRLTPDDLNGIVFSPDGSIVVTAGWSGGGLVWDPETKEVTAEFGTGTDIEAMAFTPDGSRLVTAGMETPMTFREPTTGAVTREIQSPLGIANTIAFNPDGTLMAAGGHVPVGAIESEEICVVWDVTRGEQVAAMPYATYESSAVNAAVFVDDGDTLLLAGKDLLEADEANGFWLWDVGGGGLEPVGPETSGAAADLSPSGARFALGGERGCWLSRSTGRDDLFRLTDVAVDSLAFSPDGATLAVADDEGVKLWSAATGRLQADLTDRRAVQVSFNDDGTRLASGGWYVGGSGGWLWPLD